MMSVYSSSDILYYIGFFSLTISCLILSAVGIKRSAWWNSKSIDEEINKVERKFLWLALMFFIFFVCFLLFGVVLGP